MTRLNSVDRFPDEIRHSWMASSFERRILRNGVRRFESANRLGSALCPVLKGPLRTFLFCFFGQAVGSLFVARSKPQRRRGTMSREQIDGHIPRPYAQAMERGPSCPDCQIGGGSEVAGHNADGAEISAQWESASTLDTDQIGGFGPASG